MGSSICCKPVLGEAQECSEDQHMNYNLTVPVQCTADKDSDTSKDDELIEEFMQGIR